MSWAEIVINDIDEFEDAIHQGLYTELVDMGAPVKIVLPRRNINFPTGITYDDLRKLLRQLRKDAS